MVCENLVDRARSAKFLGLRVLAPSSELQMFQEARESVASNLGNCVSQNYIKMHKSSEGENNEIAH
jgi:sulfur transfer protein SufE